MKTVFIGIIAFVFLLAAAAQAGSLGKYSLEQQPTATTQDQPSAEEIKQRLNKKIARAIEVVNSLDDEGKNRWIERYTQRYNEAKKKNNYIEAAYYQGILAGINRQE